MRAIDVMTRDVVTVDPTSDVAAAIKLLIEHDVSALPVVDAAGGLIGIISEADLVHRVEIGTEKHIEWQERMSKVHNIAEVIVAKQRHGPIGTERFFFDSNVTRFGDLAPGSYGGPFGGED